MPGSMYVVGCSMLVSSLAIFRLLLNNNRNGLNPVRKGKTTVDCSYSYAFPDRKIKRRHGDDDNASSENSSKSSSSTLLIERTERFVKQELAAQDGSHDWFHIDRVRNLALRLAKMEGLSVSQMMIVQLAALLHDIRDWKYSGSEDAGVHAVRDFLETQASAPKTTIAKVLDIVKNIGFKTELGSKNTEISPELAVVQDADRLDAIGAIGIARAFTYGGSRNRGLYDPDIAPISNITKQQYMDKGRKSPTVNHFYEKLLLLKDKMKTPSGRKIAESRHRFMEAYLARFYAEWDANM